MFGLTWTYISDALKLRGTGGAIEAISYDPVRFAKTDAPLRNIIAIQVEALDRTIINYELDGIPVTPFLNRLAAEHTYYDHVWAQHSSNGGTSDGDFSFLTAQYPLGYKGSLGARGLGQLPSVPRILSDNGYTAAAFHANRGAFFERKAGFIKLGFDRTYFKDEFTVTDPDRWHTLKDEAFFEQVGAVLDTTKQPYFAFLITLSSHSPFNMIGPEDYSIAFDGSTSLSANYFSSMRYVDEAIEKFVTTMREGDPEIVFLIYGDHTSKIHTANYTATDNNQLEPVPLIIADFSQPSNTRVSMPGSSIDFGPTLFHYLGYPAPEFWQGKALSSDGQPRPVYLIDAHHWITQEGSVEPITNGVNQQPEVKLIRRYLK